MSSKSSPPTSGTKTTPAAPVAPVATNTNNNENQSTADFMASTTPIIDNLNPSQLEHLFMHTLQETNRLSKNTEVIPREVAMAKMVNYCIRMLHSHNWNPSTVVRAMVHLEAEPERSVRGCLYQAMREKRNEGRARKEEREAETGAGAAVGDGEEGGEEDAGGVGVEVAAAAVDKLKIKAESE